MAGYKSVITNAGAAMLTQAVAQGKTVNINAVKIGDGIPVDILDTITIEGYTDVITPITVNALINDKSFISAAPSYMQITVTTDNKNLVAATPIREVGLYATDGTTTVLFAYSWIDGADTDNILPAAIQAGFGDTARKFIIALFITANENAVVNITISGDTAVSYNQMVTYVTSSMMPDLQSISDRIGYPADIASSAGNTLFKLIKYNVAQFVNNWTAARAAKVDAIDSNATNINTNVNTINTKVGANTDAAGTTTIFSYLAGILNMATGTNTYVKSGIPAVKSVQRGVANVSPGTMSITIASVNPVKCTVSLSGDVVSGASNSLSAAPYIVSLTNTAISIGSTGSGTASSHIGYEVIEFY